MTFRRWENGEAIGYTKLDADFAETYGAPYFVIHRADFHRALQSLAAKHGVEVITGSRVTDYDEAIPSASTSDGRQYTADLIVAADGVKSRARPFVLGGQDPPPQRTGFAAYRAVVCTEDMKADSNTSWLLERPGINIWYAIDIMSVPNTVLH